MRGYQTLGRRILTVHYPDGRDNTMHIAVVYKRPRTGVFMARFKRQYHYVKYDEQGWHLYVPAMSQATERKETHDERPI